MDLVAESMKQSKLHSRKRYFRLFKLLGSPKILEKMKIVISGEYNGEIIKDEWVEKEFYPKQRYLKQIYKHNKHQFVGNEWNDVFFK